VLVYCKIPAAVCKDHHISIVVVMPEIPRRHPPLRRSVSSLCCNINPEMIPRWIESWSKTRTGVTRGKDVRAIPGVVETIRTLPRLPFRQNSGISRHPSNIAPRSSSPARLQVPVLPREPALHPLMEKRPGGRVSRASPSPIALRS